jgi:hypothetical protein
MATTKNVKPTKKDSPAIRTGKAKFDHPASDYARPHTMAGKVIDGTEVMISGDYATEKSAKTANIKDPLPPSAVGWGKSTTKTDGVETRGNGAAEKGRIARGPMA